MRRLLSARVARAIEAMEKLGDRGRCPACGKVIGPRDQTQRYHGKPHHRACARYQRKLG